ncbi:hypothetical protein B0H13DRAFT_1850530 [Mycena leptocephala]|nr:hypothetical protein B0H13DRAFT_1850530 [Mycena leptocephala]
MSLKISPSHTTPTLPLELERLIFELAAFKHPPSMPSLLLVAHRAKIWIEPHLYKVLVIISDESEDPRWKTPMFIRRYRHIRQLLRLRPAAFLRDHVRHVCFFESHETEIVRELLAVCTATVDLAIPGNGGLLSTMDPLPLQRLSVDIHKLFSTFGVVNFRRSFLSNITHLDLRDSNTDAWEWWSGLASLPRLTHLHCPSLEVLVVLCSEKIQTQFRPVELPDLRLVMMWVGEWYADWEQGVRGGENYWARADAVIRTRRAGYL